MKKIRYIGMPLLAAAVMSACSTSKTLVSNGEYDDMYGTSSDAPVAYSPTLSKSVSNYDPEYLADYNDEFDPMPVDSTIEGTDSYYDENYVNSSSLKRAYTPDAGYSSGYAEGYSEGWNDYAWSGSRRMNSWNSFYDPWGFNSFSYSPFRSGFGSYLSYSPFVYGGYYGLNSFGFSPWGGGFNSFGYSPYGFNSFAYSPWGYSSFGYYSGRYNPYYGIQPVLANSSFNDARFGGSRNYGPRNSGKSTSIYNGGFINTRRPASSSVASSRRATGSSAITTSRGRISERANGTVNNTGRTYSPSSRRPTTYDSYARNTGRSLNTSSGRSTGYRGSSSAASSPRSGTFSRSSARTASSYGSTGSRTNSSGYSRSGSSSTSRNSGFSRPSNSGYSRPSSGYSRPSTSSSGSVSRGSSSSSSSRSSGGSSRGPR